MAAVFFAAVAISQGATGQYWKMIGAIALALGGAFGSRRDFKRARSSPI
jgi:hypothetical protein